MIISFLESLIGELPEGFEPLAYVVAAAVLIFILGQFFICFGMIIKRIAKI